MAVPGDDGLTTGDVETKFYGTLHRTDCYRDSDVAVTNGRNDGATGAGDADGDGKYCLTTWGFRPTARQG